MKYTCSISGEEKEISNDEFELRKKLNLPLPTMSPKYLFRELGAFWQHWSLYNRKCDKTGKDIISVFRPDCPYPVWNKDEWIKHSNPPEADFNENESVFDQMWSFFKKSPIPHNVGAGNENCEYTDDYWYSKNCYLSHSGYQNEDLRYSYRCLRCKDCMYCVMTEDCEFSIDLIDCHFCFNLINSFYSFQCSDSAFLYDCRNCQHCMFSYNLRNKKYCFNNEQLSKEEYEEKIKAWNFKSRNIYLQAKTYFKEMLHKAWHKALIIEKIESSIGNYLDQCKNCYNCYFLTTGSEDCVNCARGGADIKDCVDNVTIAFDAELIACSSMIQDKCYDIRYCYNLIQCKFMEYSAHCFQCNNCFGCCGLIGKKYYIFNKEYSKEEYEILKNKIIQKMKETGEYGKFFPGYFAANPYDESWSSIYWSLSKEEQIKFGFRYAETLEKENKEYSSIDTIIDNVDFVESDISKQVFWDKEENKPFQIFDKDIDFCKKINVCLPYSYYANRMRENFSFMPFTGELRNTRCAISGKEIMTCWPEIYDGKILSEESYLEKVI